MSYSSILLDIEDSSKHILFGEDNEYNGLELLRISTSFNSICGDILITFYIEISENSFALWLFDPDFGSGYEELEIYSQIPSEQILINRIFDYITDFMTESLNNYADIDENPTLVNFITQFSFDSNYLLDFNIKFEQFMISIIRSSDCSTEVYENGCGYIFSIHSYCNIFWITWEGDVYTHFSSRDDCIEFINKKFNF